MRRTIALALFLMLLGLVGGSAEAEAVEQSQQGWTVRRIRQSDVTPAITTAAVQILRAHRGDPYGTDIPFWADGRLYVGRIERHYHPPGGAMRPWGYHPGVSVFEVVSQHGVAPPTTPPTAPAADALEPVRQGALVLRRGSSGEAVRELQRRLRALGESGLAVDGRFGPLTEAATRRFQARAGVRVDGIVGRVSVAALDHMAPPSR